MSGNASRTIPATHGPRLGDHVSTGYQKARVNVFINPAHRHQLDVLSAEWDVPLVEAVRRVLGTGLQSIMHADDAQR
jgi:hypothetical protein